MKFKCGRVVLSNRSASFHKYLMKGFVNFKSSSTSLISSLRSTLLYHPRPIQVLGFRANYGLKQRSECPAESAWGPIHLIHDSTGAIRQPAPTSPSRWALCHRNGRKSCLSSAYLTSLRCLITHIVYEGVAPRHYTAIKEEEEAQGRRLRFQ